MVSSAGRRWRQDALRDSRRDADATRAPDAMLRAMAVRPRIAIVGPGRLGSALALKLTRAGYRVSAILSGSSSASRRRAQALARQVHARWRAADSPFDAEVVWFCVPDREIARAARQLAKLVEWKGKIALHSSGALASDELRVLRRQGAAVASVHPLMTFVREDRFLRSQRRAFRSGG